jgi:cytoskeletal protein CcmA (bactofilin family)
MKLKHHRDENRGARKIMNEDLNEANNADPDNAVTAPGAMEVDVGAAMPTTQPRRMPVVNARAAAMPLGDPDENSPAVSKVADGMRFTGNAVLNGPCSVGGQVDGNLTQAPNAVVSVVVTETGVVTGDITAQKISVMGRTNGVLDSGQGEVTLHDSASVQGRVRYGRIQVNGADLNATLERVAPNKTGA